MTNNKKNANIHKTPTWVLPKWGYKAQVAIGGSLWKEGQFECTLDFGAVHGYFTDEKVRDLFWKTYAPSVRIQSYIVPENESDSANPPQQPSKAALVDRRDSLFGKTSIFVDYDGYPSGVLFQLEPYLRMADIPPLDILKLFEPLFSSRGFKLDVERGFDDYQDYFHVLVIPKSRENTVLPSSLPYHDVCISSFIRCPDGSIAQGFPIHERDGSTRTFYVSGEEIERGHLVECRYDQTIEAWVATGNMREVVVEWKDVPIDPRPGIADIVTRLGEGMGRIHSPVRLEDDCAEEGPAIKLRPKQLRKLKAAYAQHCRSTHNRPDGNELAKNQNNIK